MTEEMDVKIRIFSRDETNVYLDLINGDDGYLYLRTDIDQRDMAINIEQLRLALRKLVTK
jgi:hypothetical protein